MIKYAILVSFFLQSVYAAEDSQGHNKFKVASGLVATACTISAACNWYKSSTYKKEADEIGREILQAHQARLALQQPIFQSLADITSMIALPGVDKFDGPTEYQKSQALGTRIKEALKTGRISYDLVDKTIKHAQKRKEIFEKASASFSGAIINQDLIERIKEEKNFYAAPSTPKNVSVDQRFAKVAPKQEKSFKGAVGSSILAGIAGGCWFACRK